MVLPNKPLEEVPEQAFGFAGMGNGSQNAVVGIAKSLIRNPTRQQVREACPDIEAALRTNTPALTLAEAHTVWDVILNLCMQYSGTLEENLNNLLSKLETMFPEENFNYSHD